MPVETAADLSASYTLVANSLVRLLNSLENNSA